MAEPPVPAEGPSQPVRHPSAPSRHLPKKTNRLQLIFPIPPSWQSKSL